MSELQRGVVKWFNDAKGFGFLEHETGRDVFVHYSVIDAEGFKTLKDGEEVCYELREGDKGLHAVKVVRINAASKAKVKSPLGESSPEAEQIKSEAMTMIETTTASMIEVERQESSDRPQPGLHASQAQEEKKSQASIEH